MRPTWILPLALAACLPTPEDTAKTDDTAVIIDTGMVVTELDGTVVGGTTFSCGWSYTGVEGTSAALVAELALPEGDRYLDADVSYSRPLDANDSVLIGVYGAGTDEIDIFDCGDVMEGLQDVHLWTMTSGHLSVDATFVREAPEATCEGTGPNPIYDATITLSDLTFTDTLGNDATLDEQVIAASIGMSYCGG